MPKYFQNMPVVGKAVKANAENVNELRAIEDDIHAHIVEALNGGKADEDMNAKGQLTAMQRDRKSTRLNSSHIATSRMPSSA